MKILVYFIALFFTMAVSAQDVVDYRYLQSGVRNQKARGTCTAFAICAALETFPGIPSNLSEQYLFAKAKFKRAMDKDSGNLGDNEMLEYYLDILEQDGVITESKMPYDTNAVTFTSDRDVFSQFSDVTKGSRIYDMLSFFNVTYRITKDQYGFYYDEDAKSIDNIKYWLNRGVKAIPVSYNINSAPWSMIDAGHPVICPDSIVAIKINSDTLSFSVAHKVYPDLISKIKENKVELVPMWTNGIFDGGHAVTIVGYNQDGFIIKNSWGTSWGNAGYAVVSYDYHKLWCRKALIFNNFNVNSNFKPNQAETYNPRDVCLKTFPVLSANKEKSIALSFLYDGNKAAPEFSNILVKFYSTDSKKGTKQYVDKASVLITPDAYKNGYLTYKKLDIDWSDFGYKELSAEVRFTLSNGKSFTNVYPIVEWKNRTLHPGYLDALLFDDDM